jgi:hypothetical protein
VTTITFAHLDAAMRIVREPERPAPVEVEENEVGVEAKAAAAPAALRPATRPSAGRDRPRALIR